MFTQHPDIVIGFFNIIAAPERGTRWIELSDVPTGIAAPISPTASDLIRKQISWQQDGPAIYQVPFGDEEVQWVRGWQFFRTAWFVPILLSPVMVGLMWRAILRLDGGALNAILTAVGLGSWTMDWLSRPSALIWLFVMTTWQTVGFYMVLILAALEDFPEELIDAARIDGTTRRQEVLFVIIPVLRPVLCTITILTFVYKMRVFDLVWVTTQGGPFGRTETVVTLVVQRPFYYQGPFNLGYPAAMSTIWLIATAIGIWALTRIFAGHSRDEG